MEADTWNELVAGWRALPDFSARLADAMRASALNAEQLAERVQQLGVSSSRQHINRLREGTSSNPSARMVHAVAIACEVDLDYFFLQEIPAEIRRTLLDRIRSQGTSSA